MAVPCMGQYAIGAVIHSDKVGEVRLAADLETSTLLHVRCSPKDVLLENRLMEQFEEDLGRALITTAGGGHPHVASIFQVYQTNLDIYAFREAVDNSTTLFAVIVPSPSPATQDNFFSFVRQIFSAVLFYHKRRVFHGCLHPDIIIVQKKVSPPAVKIGCFGFNAFFIASRAADEFRFPEAELYQAPESLFPFQKPDCDDHCLCDVWSVAAVVYHLMTGSSPRFNTGAAGTVFPLMEQIANGELRAALYKMLRPDPRARPMMVDLLLEHPSLFLPQDSVPVPSVYGPTPFSIQLKTINWVTSPLAAQLHYDPNDPIYDGTEEKAVALFTRSSRKVGYNLRLQSRLQPSSSKHVPQLPGSVLRSASAPASVLAPSSKKLAIDVPARIVYTCEPLRCTTCQFPTSEHHPPSCAACHPNSSHVQTVRHRTHHHHHHHHHRHRHYHQQNRIYMPAHQSRADSTLSTSQQPQHTTNTRNSSDLLCCLESQPPAASAASTCTSSTSTSSTSSTVTRAYPPPPPVSTSVSLSPLSQPSTSECPSGGSECPTSSADSSPDDTPVDGRARHRPLFDSLAGPILTTTHSVSG